MNQPIFHPSPIEVTRPSKTFNNKGLVIFYAISGWLSLSLSALIIFGVDTMIVFSSTGSAYIGLWYVMLGIFFGIHLPTFVFENYFLSKKLTKIHNMPLALALLVSLAIFFRDLLLIVNYIPLIHLIFWYLLALPFTSSSDSLLVLSILFVGVPILLLVFSLWTYFKTVRE
jgi:hypothetical protein